MTLEEFKRSRRSFHDSVNRFLDMRSRVSRHGLKGRIRALEVELVNRCRETEELKQERNELRETNARLQRELDAVSSSLAEVHGDSDSAERLMFKLSQRFRSDAAIMRETATGLEEKASVVEKL